MGSPEQSNYGSIDLDAISKAREELTSAWRDLASGLDTSALFLTAQTAHEHAATAAFPLTSDLTAHASALCGSYHIDNADLHWTALTANAHFASALPVTNNLANYASTICDSQWAVVDNCNRALARHVLDSMPPEYKSTIDTSYRSTIADNVRVALDSSASAYDTRKWNLGASSLTEQVRNAFDSTVWTNATAIASSYAASLTSQVSATVDSQLRTYERLNEGWSGTGSASLRALTVNSHDLQSAIEVLDTLDRQDYLLRDSFHSMSATDERIWANATLQFSPEVDAFALASRMLVPIQDEWVLEIEATVRRARSVMRRQLETMLRIVVGIRARLARSLRIPEFVYSLIVTQSRWYFLHGAHPPRPTSSRHVSCFAGEFC